VIFIEYAKKGFKVKLLPLRWTELLKVWVILPPQFFFIQRTGGVDKF